MEGQGEVPNKENPRKEIFALVEKKIEELIPEKSTDEISVTNLTNLKFATGKFENFKASIEKRSPVAFAVDMIRDDFRIVKIDTVYDNSNVSITLGHDHGEDIDDGGSCLLKVHKGKDLIIELEASVVEDKLKVKINDRDENPNKTINRVVDAIKLAEKPVYDENEEKEYVLRNSKKVFEWATSGLI